jgi:outer membrane receptor protein involved in Fe transport
MNPAINYASNINFFQGNPELDPSITNKFDFGYTIRLKTITFSTSAYFEDITDVFSFVRSPTGDDVNGIPVIRISPINVGKEQRLGYEFTLNYNPIKIWRLNSNFNFYSVKNTGNNTYLDSKGVLVVQNLNNQALTWFTRLSSKLTLPSKIDWQLNATFNGDQKTAQGKSIGMFSLNTAFSKDVLKEKGTITFNVSDVFNNRIMRSYTYFQNQTTYGELQFRKRQFILSFTYRFNKPKGEKVKNSPAKYEEVGGDF